jgi:DNA-cytosine methyltransferase
MRAISLFSGIGGLDKGFEKAGIETVLQAEQDPHALKVLARHWPGVERVTDVRLVVSDESDERVADTQRGRDGTVKHREPAGDRSIDLVYGGFPCQPFSVAGARAGIADERNMWPEFRRVVAELRPRWVVAENVPGLLSIASGSYFGTILGDLVELGYSVAWRILDAQFFGVPQRRRRVFIVAARDPLGGPGDGTAAAAVLAVRESGGGDSQESRETREGTPVAAPLGSHSTGGYRNDLDGSTFIASSIAVRGRADGQEWELGEPGISNSLRAGDGGSSRANWALVANAISASAGHHGHSSPRGDGSDNLVPAIAWALQERDAKGPDSDTKGGHLLP